MIQRWMVAWVRVGLLFLTTGTCYGEIKQANEFFGRWLDRYGGYYQYVFGDVDVSTLAHDVQHPDFLARFRKKFVKHEALMKPSIHFFEAMTGWKLYDDRYAWAETAHDDIKNRFTRFYWLIEHDMSRFIAFLKNHNFVIDHMDEEEDAGTFKVVSDRYVRMMRHFVSGHPYEERHGIHFAVANCFFEWCFDNETFPELKSLFVDANRHYRPITRFLYAHMWYHLAGLGWKHWHSACLDRANAASQAGKTLVYIAGGSDIYHLLQRGIYMIDVIDPMIPETQPRYYVDNWEWLVKGEVGDILVMDEINLRRDLIDQQEPFTVVRSDNQEMHLTRSKTEWGVWTKGPVEYRLGRVLYDRRFATQNDFKNDQEKDILISFNELYFIVAPPDQKGWGIDLEKLDQAQSLFVKQLRRPVSRSVMINMSDIEKNRFSWLGLGSCVT